MARRRRRPLLGRALVLLLVGIAIGATLFIAHRLRPEALKEQVGTALAEFLKAEWRVRDVELDLDTGIQLHGLAVLYEDGTPAIELERLALTLDHGKLLGGEVLIRQVDAYGLVVRLRRGRPGAAPSLPGIFKPPGRGDGPAPPPPPLVRIHPGSTGSRIGWEASGLLAGDETIWLWCEKLEAQTAGTGYHANARFRADRLGPVDVDIAYDLATETAEANATFEEVLFERRDVDRLSASLRTDLPPLELAGRARIETRLRASLAPFALTDVVVLAEANDLAGVFGNVHTGEAAGLPFGVAGGTCTMSYRNGLFQVPDLQAEYVSPSGARGRLGAAVRADFRRVGTALDFRLEGRGIQATTEDLHLLMEPEISRTVIATYEPAGTFDFDLRISQRDALPEKVWLDLRMRDGQLNYAGELDELTGQRFGFHYPLQECIAELSVETNIPTPRGRAEVFEIRRVEGFKPIVRPAADGPQRVAVSCRGTVRGYLLEDGTEQEDMDVRIEVRDLPIDAKLAAAFASTPGGSPYDGFDLTGWAERVLIQLEREAFVEDEPRVTYDVTLRDCTMAYENFPLPLRDVGGRIVSRDLRRDAVGRSVRRLEFDGLTGRGPQGGEISGRGYVRQSEDGSEEVRLQLAGKGLALGAELERALRESAAGDSRVPELWKKLRPHGRVDCMVDIPSAWEARVDLDLGGTCGLAGFGDIDCPIEALRGHLRYERGVVTLRDVKGEVVGAEFLLEGDVQPDGALEFTGSVRRLKLDPAVRALIGTVAPEAGAFLASIEPAETSHVDLAARAHRRSARHPLTFDAQLRNLALDVKLKGLPTSIHGGPVRVDGETLHVDDLRFRSGDAEVRIRQAELPLHPDGFGWAVLDATALHPREHFGHVTGFTPPSLGENIRLDLESFRIEFNRGDGTMIVSGAVDLRRAELLDATEGLLEPTGALGLSPLTLRLPEEEGGPTLFAGIVEFRGLNMNLPLSLVDMAGELRVAEGRAGADGLTLTGAVSGGRFHLFDRGFNDVALNLEYDGDYLRFGNIDATLYRGSLVGAVDIHLAEPGGFQVQLRASDVDLGEFLKKDLPRSEPLEGLLDAALELRSASDDITDMEGRGEIRVREGQLFRVPGLRAVLSVLGRITPLGRGGRFKRAEADFRVDGETFDLRRLHLSTATNDVYATGTISVFGDLDLVVQPQVTRILDLPRLLNLPVLSTLRNLWHKAVYEVRLEGTLSSPALRLRPLPFLKRRNKPFTESAHAGRALRIRPKILPE